MLQRLALRQTSRRGVEPLKNHCYRLCELGFTIARYACSEKLPVDILTDEAIDQWHVRRNQSGTRETCTPLTSKGDITCICAALVLVKLKQ